MDRQAEISKALHLFDGVTDLWANHEVEVSGISGTYEVGGIQFVIADVAGDFIDIQATIPTSAAAPEQSLHSPQYSASSLILLIVRGYFSRNFPPLGAV